MNLLIWLFCIIIVFGALFYALRLLPLEEPWNKIAMVILVVVFILFLVLNVIAPLLGYGPVLVYR